MPLYTVSRCTYQFRATGELDYTDVVVIGAVAADSPLDALDVALEFFPWKPNHECRVKAVKGGNELLAAHKWATNRVRENWEFRRWLTTEAFEPECRGK